MTAFNIVFPIFNDASHLDFTGPHEIFTSLSFFDLVKTNVAVASVNASPVTATGLTFSQLANLNTLEQCDLLCVPGGPGTLAAIKDSQYMDNIIRLAKKSQYITSVCTGSLILGAAGLLQGKRAACHWAWRDMLPQFGAIVDNGRVVRDGNIITGGGVTAGIDFALVVLQELFGDSVAQSAQLSVEYNPCPPFNAGSPETAPQSVYQAIAAWSAKHRKISQVEINSRIKI